MKNQSNRLKHKKKIFECFLSIHKSIGNVLITNTNKDKINQKYEILKQKVTGKNHGQILEDKNHLREKRLNTIFHKNNTLCTSQNNEEFHISNISNNSKSKFAEKYTELYNITTNNSRSKKREKNNSVSYLLNNLKNMNYAFNYRQSLNNHITSKDILLNQKINDLKNDSFNSKTKISKLNNTHQAFNRNNNTSIRNKIFNCKIDGIKNVLKSMDKIKTDANKNFLLNNYIKNPSYLKNSNNNKTRKESYISYYNMSKSIKTNKDLSMFDKDKNRNARIKKNNLFTINNKNINLIGNEDKNDNDRIIHKVNHFKVRLNLISMK